ncbi:TldD/PmbA family protein [Acidisphaera sp. L21]|uniref:TldD/PmbA family protein n=1 Tax=Acidisphaera sp. L21 TaxID=1641851 RepID=UPI00131AADA5|nr:metallopeptidase TldD-related protein [Acidisphaera sp. L21]
MSQLDLLTALLDRARQAGADTAEAAVSGSTSLSISRRLGQTEHLERSERRGLELTVFVGKRSASVSTTEIAASGFAALAERAVAMAKVVPEDPYGGLADNAQTVDAGPLELADLTEPTVEALTVRAALAEDAARAVPGITNSEGGEAGYGRYEFLLATSAGFLGGYARTSHSVSATALAGEGVGMQRDYDYHSATFLSDLDDPVAIGTSAAHRAIARLNPTRPATAKLPVLFDPRVAGGLIGHLAGAVSGSSVARGTTFLKDSLGKQIFARGIRITDEPRRLRGPRSRPFDGEGIPSANTVLIDDGVLTTWLMDSRAARQLGLQAKGSPGLTNAFLSAGKLTPADLMADITEGLYITELMGQGINGLTGDYSRGAAGFMIRNGALAEPVAEITIASNLKEMFLNLTPANDLRFRRAVDAPTVRIDGMTMAGG